MKYIFLKKFASKRKRWSKFYISISNLLVEEKMERESEKKDFFILIFFLFGSKVWRGKGEWRN